MRAVASAIAIVLALFFSHYRGDTYSRDDTNANYYKNYFKRSHIFTPLSRNNLRLITCNYASVLFSFAARFLFLMTMITVTAAITAAQMNAVHHAEPIV